MKAYIRTFFALFALLVCISIFHNGCKKEEITNVTQQQVISYTNPLKGQWQVKSIKLDDGPGAPPSGARQEWRQTLLNSGIMTTFGNATLAFADTNFTISGSVNAAFASLFPQGLTGSVAGMYLLPVRQFINVEDNLIYIYLRSWLPAQMFAYVPDPVEAKYLIFGNQLTIIISARRIGYVTPNTYVWNEIYTTVWEKSP